MIFLIKCFPFITKELLGVLTKTFLIMTIYSYLIKFWAFLHTLFFSLHTLGMVDIIFKYSLCLFFYYKYKGDNLVRVLMKANLNQ